jgi:hypothetical protein
VCGKKLLVKECLTVSGDCNLVARLGVQEINKVGAKVLIAGLSTLIEARVNTSAVNSRIIIIQLNKLKVGEPVPEGNAALKDNHDGLNRVIITNEALGIKSATNKLNWVEVAKSRGAAFEAAPGQKRPLGGIRNVTVHGHHLGTRKID